MIVPIRSALVLVATSCFLCSAQEAVTKVYVAEFQGIRGMTRELLTGFTNDFELVLMETGTYEVLERRRLDRLVQHARNEMTATTVRELTTGMSDALKRQGAQGVIFGEIDDDTDSGEIVIYATLERFDSRKEWKRSVSLKRGLKADRESRLDALRKIVKRPGKNSDMLSNEAIGVNRNAARPGGPQFSSGEANTPPSQGPIPNNEAQSQANPVVVNGPIRINLESLGLGASPLSIALSLSFQNASATESIFFAAPCCYGSWLSIVDDLGRKWFTDQFNITNLPLPSHRNYIEIPAEQKAFVNAKFTLTPPHHALDTDDRVPTSISISGNLFRRNAREQQLSDKADVYATLNGRQFTFGLPRVQVRSAKPLF